MRKFIKCLLFLLIGIPCFLGCKGTSFKLNFIVDNAIYESIDTNGNETIDMPNDPKKENYIFEGWYWDKDVWQNEFTARSLLDVPLSENLEVYAHFIDDSYLKGTDINIVGSKRLNVEGVGDVFYLVMKNNQLVCKFNDYVEINPQSTWTLSTDIGGNRTIASKTVELSLGDNPLYYIYVTDKNNNHETYIVLVHRNYLCNVSFNGNGGTTPSPVIIEEGEYLDVVPRSKRTGYEFQGWDFDFLYTKISKDVVANAKWKAKEYTITYDANGGQVASSSQKATYDSSVYLETPLRNGYDFDGWYLGEEKIESPHFWNYEYNINLTANWKVHVYNISYKLNGGTNNPLNKTSYTIQDYAYNLSTPTKQGYTFKGWTSSPSETPIVEYRMPAYSYGDITFEAHWEANKYTTNFDVNGGYDLTSSSLEYTYDSFYNLPTPTKNGYSFDGWYYGEKKINDGLWKIDSDVTLVAHWTINRYQITYVLNGGLNDSLNPSSYTFDDQDISLSSPTRDGYTFKGWTTFGVSTPTKNLKVAHNSTGNVSFEAHWEANIYQATYDVNGGDALQYKLDNFIFDSEVTLPTPTRTGYSFDSWCYNETRVTNGTWKIASDCSLKANWIANDYMVNKNDGIGTGTSTVYYDSPYNLGIATKEGYDFNGWYSEENGEGTQYTDKEGNSLNNYNNLTDIDLYAFFTYTVTFASNGGSENDDVVLKENELLPNNIVSKKKNRTFGGWYTDANLTNPVSYEGSLGNITLYAKWDEEVSPSKLTYSITNDNDVTITGNSFTGTSLILPSHIGGLEVKKIGDYAFKDLAFVVDLYVPDNVESIGEGAFNGFNSLENITLPFVGGTDGAADYTSTFGYIFGCEIKSSGTYGHFLGNENVSNLFFNKQYDSATNSAIWQFSRVSYRQSEYYYDLTSYYYYIPASLKNVTITIDTTIPAAAFNGCSMIENITIPSETSSIGTAAFQNCTSLTQLNSYIDGTFNIPQNVGSIKEYTFKSCGMMSVVTLSEKVTEIGDYAFASCSLVENFNSNSSYSLKTPESCITIGAYAFQDMALISDVVVTNNVESIGEGAFNGFNSLENIALPFVGGTDGAADYTSTFGYIFGFEIKSSGTYGRFLGNEKVSNLFFNKQYDSATNSAIWQFSRVSYRQSEYYYDLTSYYYYIPASLKNVTITIDTTIPAAAFNGCSMIENIHLVNCIDSIGNYAFQNCTATIDYLINPTRSGIWDGSTIATSYHGGIGTLQDPYQIFSASEFVYFLNQLRDGENYDGVYFVLTSNINFGGYAINATALTEATSFKGVLDGNSHKVFNFTVTTSDNSYNGLFGYVDGTIKNTGFETSMNVNTSKTTDVYVGLIIGMLNGSIENVYASGSLTSTSLRTSYVGGLVGYNNGSILNSYATVNVTATSTNLKCYAAGLVGYNNGSITGSFAYGNVYAKGYAESYSYSSGLVALEGNDSTVTNSYRCNGQTITRFGNSSTSYNNVGESSPLEGIITYCKSNWNGSIWSFNKTLPSF